MFCNFCCKQAKFLCNKCKKVPYCGVSCQQNDWKMHQDTCARFSNNSDLENRIFKRVLDALPFGSLENCHGCDSKSYGFKWALEVETKEVLREMCLECLYRIMQIDKIKQNETYRKSTID